ncbi:hypothetical protein [Streptococcus suis]|uniref:hypothetical protein n=1 Tax=Streptococcus suis TaxID=1307 RepID=UPI00094551D8|nr:hypothetical protein [Streptococcus suis]MCB2927368.1 hypothetical protein [Streptococcus suis]HEL2468079.1 hypothetical protein [Streptococcus suis]HEL2668420.1 hypothetical protein [Streptococcus suis]HEL2731398.1 hypothetical protein [Streptococcus suis]HEM4042906.1 hypothetical protein [Streptococcus suis]
MNNIVGLYTSLDDIGNHERHYTKLGDFQKANKPCIVRYVSSSDATVRYHDEVYSLEAGMILGADALVDTNNSFVEITDSYENIYRLAPESQFCLEMTVKGVIPVHFGHVHVIPSYQTIEAGGKYRTSCYTGRNQVTIEIVANNIDVYYSYDKPVEVFEFDELGNKFTLFTLAPYQKCVLQDQGGSMRDRYHVLEQSNLENSEVTRLYETYCMPFNWRSQAEEVQLSAQTN